MELLRKDQYDNCLVLERCLLWKAFCLMLLEGTGENTRLESIVSFIKGDIVSHCFSSPCKGSERHGKSCYAQGTGGTREQDRKPNASGYLHPSHSGFHSVHPQCIHRNAPSSCPRSHCAGSPALSPSHAGQQNGESPQSRAWHSNTAH